MKELELSPRLLTVARCVPPGSRLADVGTDHAYLPVWLIRSGVISGAIASELRRGPLERARDTAGRYQVTGQMDFRLCDGLAGISPEEADTVTIAGMGGETIAAILAQAPWTKDCRLILQPMSSLPELRTWLQQNGYAIRQELLSLDQGTIYVTMTVRGGDMPPLTVGERYAGRPACWAREALRGDYLDYLLNRAVRELDGVSRSSKAQDVPRRNELAQVIRELREWKEDWNRDNCK